MLLAVVFFPVNWNEERVNYKEAKDQVDVVRDCK